ncbi:MAG: twin-arginine translocase TatA/TatE family subunit [candidate division WOR-3 bacterium]|jgi:sec-independent protein translocase protein TatA|nr:MAG: twin-arginine translocase TatA/TatE family subunit [candidate division WOR-3 bacterium]
MFGIGWQEILLIALIVLLLFGAKKIPEVMRSVGKGIRELKKGMKEIESEAKDEGKKDENAQ